MQDIALRRIDLSGGGDEKQSFPLDEFFFTDFPPNARFLYVPIALRGHRLYPGAKDWMTGLLAAHARSDIAFDVVDDPGAYADALARYYAVYIGGGNTWSLHKELSDSGFMDALSRYVRAGGIVYGGSAGAIILGKRIDTQDDARAVTVDSLDGLDLLGGHSIVPHFKNEERERFRSLAMEHSAPILAIPEEGGIAIVGMTATVFGAPITRFASDGDMRVISPSETFSLE